MNKINWRVRFGNKVWLGSLIAFVLSFVYGLLAMFDVYPAVTQNTVLQIANYVLEFLSLIGIIVDPTTEGISDSKRAMSYVEPWHDEPDE